MPATRRASSFAALAKVLVLSGGTAGIGLAVPLGADLHGLSMVLRGFIHATFKPSLGPFRFAPCFGGGLKHEGLVCAR